jgi:hypothetical protein
MGPASPTVSSDPVASGEPAPTERSPSSPAPRRNDGPRRNPSGVMERRVPTPRETMATLPEAEAEVDAGFEPHDTIPAPPWLEDEIVTPQKSS